MITFQEVLDEVFDGKSEAVHEALHNWPHPLNYAQATLAVLCYIAWKLAEIERKTMGPPN